MTIKIHGVVNSGEFLTGNIDFFTITTIVPCDNTNVSIPLARLKSDLRIGANNISTVGGFNVAGINYANDNAYIDGFNKQNNLDFLLQMVDTRVAPIMINVVDLGVFADVDTAIPTNSTETSFGSTYSGNAGTIYSIKFAVEHESVWEQETLALEFDAKIILDLIADVISGADQFDTSSASLINTVVLKNNFL